jgi:hypothetical protein
MKEELFKSIMDRTQEVRNEAVDVAEEVLSFLKEVSSDLGEEDNGLRIVQRWECAETILAALKLCVQVAREQDPLGVQNLSRQLRRWRREQGEGELGWLEVRTVQGHGPYIYYRWRKLGSRKIHTEYYGRGDLLVAGLAVVADRRDEHMDLLE